MLKAPGSSPGRWCISIWSRGAIPHSVVHVDFGYRRDYTFGGGYGFVVGWSFTFDFDKFILISNLQTTDVSFMPRVAVGISLHALLIHALVCVFFLLIQRNKTKSSHCPIKVKIIHSFWVLRCFVRRENRKNLRIDWEKMYAIHLKLESN